MPNICYSNKYRNMEQKKPFSCFLKQNFAWRWKIKLRLAVARNLN